jgi:hypothetical protein
MSYWYNVSSTTRERQRPRWLRLACHRAEEDLSVPERTPLSETAPVNPVLLSKKLFSVLFVFIREIGGSEK